ncbi:AAI domain-containing protein [Psidium guajava]|nr:AAI domain-containing protein [Psidium guajava]
MVHLQPTGPTATPIARSCISEHNRINLHPLQSIPLEPKDVLDPVDSAISRLSDVGGKRIVLAKELARYVQLIVLGYIDDEATRCPSRELDSLRRRLMMT